jgi:hypothetical protein
VAPPAFPHRDLILFAAFSVVLGTLVIQGLTLRPLLAVLGIKEDDTVDREVQLARAAAAQAALQALNEQPVSIATTVIRREYETRLRASDQGESLPPVDDSSELALAQQRAIEAERRTITDLRRRGEIGDDAFHRIEEELDWVEVHVARRVSGDGANR